MQLLFWQKNFDNRNSPSPGLFSALDLQYPELSLLYYVKPIEKYLALELRTGTG
jgi:hypothetical protein